MTGFCCAARLSSAVVVPDLSLSANHVKQSGIVAGGQKEQQDNPWRRRIEFTERNRKKRARTCSVRSSFV